MKASLDTDITIHLYSSGKQGLMFTFFDKLYMHIYLYEMELKRKSPLVYVNGHDKIRINGHEKPAQMASI
jgi:hypothetical protein